MSKLTIPAQLWPPFPICFCFSKRPGWLLATASCLPLLLSQQLLEEAPGQAPQTFLPDVLITCSVRSKSGLGERRTPIKEGGTCGWRFSLCFCVCLSLPDWNE